MAISLATPKHSLALLFCSSKSTFYQNDIYLCPSLSSPWNLEPYSLPPCFRTLSTTQRRVEKKIVDEKPFKCPTQKANVKQVWHVLKCGFVTSLKRQHSALRDRKNCSAGCDRLHPWNPNIQEVRIGRSWVSNRVSPYSDLLAILGCMRPHLEKPKQQSQSKKMA